jgi:hypothetical protein
MFNEKRRAERVEILGRMGGAVTVFQPLTVVEVSIGGIQVETDFPLTVDSVHDFRLTLGERTVNVRGRVTHCRLADVDHERVLYRNGVEVLEMNDALRQTFETYVDSLREPKSTLTPSS